MKKNKNSKEERTPPLPEDKPASHPKAPAKDADHERGVRQYKKAPPKSTAESPQKAREKMEMDTSKKERDPGMTER
jgi:hypothetical protein